MSEGGGGVIDPAAMLDLQYTDQPKSIIVCMVPSADRSASENDKYSKLELNMPIPKLGVPQLYVGDSEQND